MAVQPDVEGQALIQAPKRSERILGLDSLRFILAAMVMFNHLQFIPFLGNTGRKINVGLDLIMNGPAAVIIFFLISGLCIHRPYAQTLTLGKSSLLSYLARREIRILVPVLGIFLTCMVLKFEFVRAAGWWSLICEEIYYLIYPAMLAIRAKYGWKPILAVTFAISPVIYFVNPLKAEVHGAGPMLTWLFLYPVWLMGCVIAEKFDTLPVWNSPTWKIWAWRLSMLALAGVTKLVRFHGHHEALFGYSVSMIPFGILGYFWLTQEISYARTHPPKPFLEKLGAASFTLYVAHFVIGVVILERFGLQVPIDKPVGGRALNVHDIFASLTMFAGVAMFVWVFYLLVEAPSHKAARSISKLLLKRSEEKAAAA